MALGGASINIPYNSKYHCELYHNTKQKCYPNGSSKITVCTKAIFKENGWLPSDDSDILHEMEKSKERIEQKHMQETETETKPKNMMNETRSDSLKRAKEKAFDIALMNDFEYFITWTLDKEKIDRYDTAEISKKLQQKLKDMVKRKDLKYLIIPEHHQDGAIHMHGLISGNVAMQDSGTWIVPKCKKPVSQHIMEELGHNEESYKVHKVYNMPDWIYGWSTAIKTHGESINVAKYITKYITKDLKKIFGNFYYAGGHGLKREAPVKVFDVDYDTINGDVEVYVEQAHRGFKYITTTV